MKTFKDLGFEIDKSNMPVIVAQIQQIKTVKIENMADTLTDREAPAILTAEEIAWMQTTPISQVTAGENYMTNDSSIVFNLSVDNDPFVLTISGRAPTLGEFRGENVRKVIDSAKSTNNTSLTVYEAFQAHITNVTENDQFQYAINGCINHYLSNNFDFGPQSDIFKCLQTVLRDILNSFGQSVFNSLEQLDQFNEDSPANPELTENANEDSPVNQELTEKAYKFLQNKLQTALNDHSASQKALFDFFNAFDEFKEQLEIVKQKSDSFEQKSKAYSAATELFSSLNNATNQLIEGGITFDIFMTSCEAACKKAESSALKEHRGWKQVFANIGFAFVSFATLGIANLISKRTTGSYDFSKTNTDSINKTLEMKKKLQGIGHLPNDTEGITAESANSHSHRPPGKDNPT